MEPSFIAGEVIESPRKRPVDAVMPEVPSEKKAKGMKVWDTQLFISSSPFLFFLSFFQNSFSLFRLLRGYLFLMWTEMNSFFCFLFVYVGKYRLLELPLEIGFERNAFLSNSVHQLFLFLKNESTHEYTSEEVLQHVTLSRT